MGEYKIVEALTESNLALFVTSEMGNGWMPTGGVALLVGPMGNPTFYQAMVYNPKAL
jgi:hypothetical protein